MSTGYLSTVGRATFGLFPSQLFKLVHRWLQILPSHRSYRTRMLSGKAELAAELTPVIFHGMLQNPAKMNLALGGVQVAQ